MFHPLCGYSLHKGAKFIAILDLILVFLSMTLRFIVYEYQEYEAYEFETELLDANDTSTEPHRNSSEAASSSDEFNAAQANLTSQLLEIFRQSHAMHEEQQEHYLVIAIITIAITGVVYLAYMGLEVYLCRLLWRASVNRDGSACKLWFWVRLFVTLIILMFSIVGIATLKYDWVDWVLEPLNLYRIYELLVINEFKREIAATSGRVKLRA